MWCSKGYLQPPRDRGQIDDPKICLPDGADPLPLNSTSQSPGAQDAKPDPMQNYAAEHEEQTVAGSQIRAKQITAEPEWNAGWATVMQQIERRAAASILMRQCHEHSYMLGFLSGVSANQHRQMKRNLQTEISHIFLHRVVKLAGGGQLKSEDGENE